MSVVIYGVDGKPKPAADARPAPCTGPHCWHLRAEQHTVPNHSDWACCFCDVHHCVRARGLEHGPHAGPSAEKGCGVVLGQVELP